MANLIAALIAAIVATSVVSAQRTSPQFSFPSALANANNNNNNQFGSSSDLLFGPGGPNFGGLADTSGQALNSAGPQSLGLPGQLGSGSQLPPLLPPLDSSVQQQQQQQPAPLRGQSLLESFQASQQQQQQQPSIQLARPSLSLTSFQSSVASSAQQSVPSSPSLRSSSQALVAASLPQTTSSISSSISTTSSSSSSVVVPQQAQAQAPATPTTPTSHQHNNQQQHPSHHQSSRQSQSLASPQRGAAASATNSASGRQSASPTTGRQHNAPAPAPASAAAAASPASQQAAIEAARKAEASAASLAASSGSYLCPDSFGFFRHHKSCDKYWACENGTATLKLCGNGLMFDDSDPRRENCAYPFSVDCGSDRTDLEPPISTPHCPRLYGLFADTSNCRVFYSCWNGEASKYECPPGLAYDNEQRVCVWADLVDRCDQSEVSDGFVCPDSAEADQPGHYTRHAHPTDCRKFYVCIDGTARPYGCSFGSVFNIESLQCDEPDNVSGCEKYYGDLDPKLAKKLARENAQQHSGNTPPASRASTGSATSTSSA